MKTISIAHPFRLVLLFILMFLIRYHDTYAQKGQILYSEEFNITSKSTFVFRAYQSDDQTFYFNISKNISNTNTLTDNQIKDTSINFTLATLDNDAFEVGFINAMKKLGIERELDSNKISPLDLINGMTVVSVRKQAGDLFTKIDNIVKGHDPDDRAAGQLGIKNSATVYDYSDYIANFFGYSKKRIIEGIVITHKNIRILTKKLHYKNEAIRDSFPQLFDGEIDILRRLTKYQLKRLTKRTSPENYNEFYYSNNIFSMKNCEMFDSLKTDSSLKYIEYDIKSKFKLNKKPFNDSIRSVAFYFSRKIKIRKNRKYLLEKLESMQELLSKMNTVYKTKIEKEKIKSQQRKMLIKIIETDKNINIVKNNINTENNALNNNIRIIDSLLANVEKANKENKKKQLALLIIKKEKLKNFNKLKKKDENLKFGIKKEIQDIQSVIEISNHYSKIYKSYDSTKNQILLDSILRKRDNRIKDIQKVILPLHISLIETKNKLYDAKLKLIQHSKEIKTLYKQIDKIDTTVYHESIKTNREKLKTFTKALIIYNLSLDSLIRENNKLFSLYNLIGPGLFEVKLVNLEISEGNLKNIEVVGTYKGEEKKFVNLTPIPFSSILDYNFTASLYSFNFRKPPENYKYRIYLSDVLDYLPKFHVNSEDYSPEDVTLSIKPNDPRQWVLKKPPVDKLLDARIYTDLIGLSGNQPNGLVQTEVSRRIFIRPKRIAMPYFGRHLAYYGFLNYVEPSVTISKLENTNKEIIVRGDTKEKRKIETLDLLRYGNFNMGVKMNLFVIDINQAKSSFYLNFGGKYIRTSISDTLSKIKANKSFNINTLYSYLELLWVIKQDHRFGLTMGPKVGYIDSKSNKITQVGDSTASDGKNFWMGGFQIDASLNFNDNNRLFFRGNYFNLLDNMTQNFFQAQLGVSFDILKRRKVLGSIQ